MTKCDRLAPTWMIVTNASTELQSLKFVPNGLLSLAGTTANEEVQVEAPSSSMLIESLIPYPTNSNTPIPLY